MKKARTKLTLHRETIGNLNEGKLIEVAGATGGITFCLTCITDCNCPTQNTACPTQTDCVQTYRC